jgi:serine/threonine protein kinase
MRAWSGALGSPGFVAPEIIMHQEHTPAMDVFSLGVVLFIMLVGRKPYNIKECENLSYCNMDIRAAPGLQDSRSVPQGIAMSLSSDNQQRGPHHRFTPNSSEQVARPQSSGKGAGAGHAGG